MSYRVLVVSTWGNFKQYQPAQYSYEVPGAGRRSLRCRSPALALAQLLGEYGERDVRLLVTLPHTLLAEEDIGGDLLNQQSIDHPVMTGRIAGRARDTVMTWIDSGDCEVSSDLVNRLDFAVVPAVASFTKPSYKLYFDSRPNLYQLVTYYHVYRALVSGDYGEVYLDSTHGINYMPLLVNEAVRFAIYTYSARRLRRIRYIVVNSDPYPYTPQSGQTEVPDLSIHEVYQETVISRESPSRVGAMSFETLKWYAKVHIRITDLYDDRKWGKEPLSKRALALLIERLTPGDMEALRLGLVVSASLRDSLYPVLLSLKDEIEKYRDRVNSELERLAKSFVKIEREGGRVFVKYMYRPSILMAERGITYRAVMAMHAALEVAHKLVEDVRNDVKLVNNSVAFTVDAMETLNNTYGSIASRAVVGNEIMKLRRIEREVNMDFMGKHVGKQYKLTLFEAHPLNELWNKCVRGDNNACSELGSKLDSVDRGEGMVGIDDTKYDFCAIVPKYGDGAIINKYRDLVSHAGLDMYNTYVMITEEGGRRKPLITYGDKLNCLMDLIYRGILIEVATDEAVQAWV